MCQARDQTWVSAETQDTAVWFLMHCTTAGMPIYFVYSSVLYIVGVKLIIYSFPHLSTSVTIKLFSVCDSVFLSQISSFFIFFLWFYTQLISYDICLSLTISLSMIIYNSIHVVANYIFSFCLWLSNISLHIYTTSSLLILMYGQLGYHHIFVIVNNAAMNIGLHVPFWIRVFFWTYVLNTHTHTHTHIWIWLGHFTVL